MEKGLNLLREFVCKVCDKKYPCGKSLGGHMRSHVIAAPPNSAESEENSDAMKKVPFLYEAVGVDGALDIGGGPTGYGLRENPKKTWRAADSTTTATAATFALPQEERFCKRCGKGFQSLKALCGHMACHSEKDRFFMDQHCWTNGGDSFSDTEAADDLIMKRQTRSKSKRCKTINVVVKASQFDLPSYDNHASNGDGGGSSVSEIDEVEVENVAMCLMMLSRDTWNWYGVNSVVESPDNNSVVVETKSSSIGLKFGRRGGLKFGDDEGVDTKKFGGRYEKLKLSAFDVESGQYQNSGYLRNEAWKVESDISVDEVLRNGDYKNMGRVEIYDAGLMGEGLTQGKQFAEFGSSSRAMNSNKRLRDCSCNPESRMEAIKKMLHDFSDEEQSKNACKRSKYECLNCNKTFNSFQGLGGHRPCHKKPKAKVAATRHENGDNSLEVDDVTLDSTPIGKLGERLTNKKIVGRDFCGNEEKRKGSKKSKAHKCPVCFRMFKSGQALGGHKRSHFHNGSDDFGNPTVVIKEEAADVHENHDLIDLNLPAPEADNDTDEDDQFVCWD